VKINDTRPVAPLNTESQSTAGGKGVSQNNAVADSKSANTGVNVSVNPALAQAAQAGSPATALSETKALEEIRRLIEKGEYKIDFPKVAESMVRDALASIDSKKSA
jgi:flagellar biosynthesis anti-sigma factor FlgM